MKFRRAGRFSALCALALICASQESSAGDPVAKLPGAPPNVAVPPGRAPTPADAKPVAEPPGRVAPPLITKPPGGVAPPPIPKLPAIVPLPPAPGAAGNVPLPIISSVAVLGCGSAEAFDTGHVLYLVASGQCEPTGPIVLDLDWGASRPRSKMKVQFSGFDQPIATTFSSGPPAELSGTRVISLHRAGKWRSFPNEGTWQWRDGAGLLNFKGALYLLGGWNSDGLLGRSEVWRTYDLENWELLTDQAPWPARHGAGWLVHKGRMYVIGGDLIDDSWSSDDGIHWRQEAINAPFGGRYTPNVISDGRRILLYGGQYWVTGDICGSIGCVAVGLNDVWSSDDGAHWNLLRARAPWTPRGLVHGGAFFNGRVYVIGGGLKGGVANSPYSETVEEFTDIWSSADGLNWRQETTQLGFPPRTHFALLATKDGCYVANGSVASQFNTTGEVFFAPDCVHFAEVSEPSPMGPRHASSLAEFNGSIVILGGHRDTAGTRIWQYFPRPAATPPQAPPTP